MPLRVSPEANTRVTGSHREKDISFKLARSDISGSVTMSARISDLLSMYVGFQNNFSCVTGSVQTDTTPILQLVSHLLMFEPIWTFINCFCSK